MTPHNLEIIEKNREMGLIKAVSLLDSKIEAGDFNQSEKRLIMRIRFLCIIERSRKIRVKWKEMSKLLKVKEKDLLEIIYRFDSLEIIEVDYYRKIIELPIR